MAAALMVLITKDTNNTIINDFSFLCVNQADFDSK